MKRKLLMLFLCSAAVLALLTGCSGSDSGSQPTQAADQSGGKSSGEDSGKAVTIRYGIWDSNQEPSLRAIADTISPPHHKGFVLLGPLQRIFH